MKCKFKDCDNKVEHPERDEWYGLCNKHAKEQERISKHFSKLGKKSWEKRKEKIINPK